VFFARGFIVDVTVIAYLVALYLKSKQGIFEIAIRFAFSGFAAMAPVMIAALFWKRSTKWGALASTLFVAATLIGFGMLQGKPAPPPAALAKPLAAKAAVPSSNDVAVAKAEVPKVDQTNMASMTNAANMAELSNTNAPVAEAKPAAPKPTAGGPPKPKMDIIWQVGGHVILSRAPATGDVRFWNSSTNPAGGFMTVVPMVFGSALCMIIFSLLTRPPGRATIDKYFSQTKSASSTSMPTPAAKA
jgi:hypothetical protein